MIQLAKPLTMETQMNTDPLQSLSERETSLRLMRLELAMEKLTADLQKNTVSTAELVEAWNGSKWLLAMLKGAAVLAATVVSCVAGWKTFLGAIK